MFNFNATSDNHQLCKATQKTRNIIS